MNKLPSQPPTNSLFAFSAFPCGESSPLSPLSPLRLLLLAGIVLAFSPALAGTISPARTTNDLDNPHKGFMLWGTDYPAGAPLNHYGSTVFHVYVPWREIETADNVFDWAGFDTRHLQPVLDDHTNATFVLRPVADYPDGENSGVTLFYGGVDLTRDFPAFLTNAPLDIDAWEYSSCEGNGPGITPDWYDCNSAHSAALNANRKAYAAWALWCKLAADLDRDYIPDSWEETYGGTCFFAGGDHDRDKDGASDVEEHRADTNPTNAASVFTVTSISNSSPMTVHFHSSSSRRYSLLYSPSLVTGKWSAVNDQTNMPGTDGPSSLTDTNPPAGNRSYRLGVQLP